MGSLVLALAIPVIIGLYLLPTVVAVKRSVPDRGSVAVINVLLGWSFIGWVVALALAFRSPATGPAPSPSDSRGLSAASHSGETGTMPAPRAHEEDSHATGDPDP